MKTLKMNLESIQGKLSRMEMKNIVAGSDGTQSCAGKIQSNCSGGCTDGFNNKGNCGWISIQGLTGCLCFAT